MHKPSKKIINELLHTVFFIIAFGALLVFPIYKVAAQTVQNPQRGSVGMGGTVPGPAPDEPAVIEAPQNGDSFGDNPVLVRGSCLPDLLVQVYRNGAFAGSSICLEDGTFEVRIDLVNGQNVLVARVFDSLNQEGPDSNAVTVTYSPRSDSDDEFGSTENQVILTSSFGSRGVDPDDLLTWPMGVTGGVPPYAISIDWGDGQTELYSITDSGTFDAEHTYKEAGVYRVIVKATDTNGSSGYMELITVVNGEAVAGITQQGGGAQVSAPTIERYILWPVYALALAGVAAFFIGRRLEKIKQNKRFTRQYRNRQSTDNFSGLHTPSHL